MLKTTGTPSWLATIHCDQRYGEPCSCGYHTSPPCPFAVAYGQRWKTLGLSHPGSEPYRLAREEWIRVGSPENVGDYLALHAKVQP